MIVKEKDFFIESQKNLNEKRDITLFDHQNLSIQKSLQNDTGKFILPTGTGKSYIQFGIIEEHIKLKQNDKDKGVFLINSPRILLSYQILRGCFEYITYTGLECIFLLVHSGNAVDEDEYDEIRISINKQNKTRIEHNPIKTTTNVELIKDRIKNAEDLGLPIVICSTYHSMIKVRHAVDRLQKGRRKNNLKKINLILNDEAHNLTEKSHFDDYQKMGADKNFFFTATEKLTTSVSSPEATSSGRSMGMGNLKMYGENIYEMSPKTAIMRGLICPPRIVTMVGDRIYNNDDMERSVNHVIKTAFEELDDLVNTSGKLLVSVKGVGEIQSFIGSKEFDDLRKKGVEIFSIASTKKIGNNINGFNLTNTGSPINRSDWLDELNIIGKDLDKKLLVLHYDILAEGIDVSGFNGLLPLRNLEKSKFVQTYGRCARRVSADFHRLVNGEIAFNDYDKMIKPFSYIFLTDLVLEDYDKMELVASIIFELRNNDEPLSEYFTIKDDTNGMGSTEDEDEKNKTPVKNRIKDLSMEYENLRLASMDFDDYLKGFKK